jgi:anti-sigma B factor antagonist
VTATVLRRARRTGRMRPVSDPLLIDARDAGGIHVLALSGELDLESAPELASRIDRARGSGVRRVLVDLSDVDFCDSTGLRALMGAEQELRIAGGRLTVVCPGGGQVARLLDLTGTREALHVFEDPERAAARLR